MPEQQRDDNAAPDRRSLMVVVQRESDWLPLLSAGHRLARAMSDVLLLLVLSADGERPQLRGSNPDAEVHGSVNGAGGATGIAPYLQFLPPGFIYQ